LSASDGFNRLRELARQQAPEFFSELRQQTAAANCIEDVLMLSSLRRRMAAKGFAPQQKPARIALLGGCTMSPLNEMIGHFLSTTIFPRYWNRTAGYTHFSRKLWY
jgi:hypothetical protein